MLQKRLQVGLCVIALLSLVPFDLCQAKSKGKDKAQPADVFTPPAEMTANIPTFVDGSGQPLKPFDATGADGSEPNIDVIRRLPSLTGPQRKALDKLLADSRVQKAALQDGIKSMQSQLKNRQTSSNKPGAKPQPNALTKPAISFTPAKPQVANAAGQEMDNAMEMQQQGEMREQETMVQEPPPEEEIKAKIQSSTDQIKQANKQLWQFAVSVLTAQQRDELDKMRHGQLMITTANGSQSLTDKKSDTVLGAMNPYKPESVSASINKGALKRILSNQGKHEKTPDFSGL
jgi:hypothetical protein